MRLKNKKIIPIFLFLLIGLSFSALAQSWTPSNNNNLVDGQEVTTQGFFRANFSNNLNFTDTITLEPAVYNLDSNTATGLYIVYVDDTTIKARNSAGTIFASKNVGFGTSGQWEVTTTTPSSSLQFAFISNTTPNYLVGFSFDGTTFQLEQNHTLGVDNSSRGMDLTCSAGVLANSAGTECTYYYNGTLIITAFNSTTNTTAPLYNFSQNLQEIGSAWTVLRDDPPRVFDFDVDGVNEIFIVNGTGGVIGIDPENDVIDFDMQAVGNSISVRGNYAIIQLDNGDYEIAVIQSSGNNFEVRVFDSDESIRYTDTVVGGGTSSLCSATLWGNIDYDKDGTQDLLTFGQNVDGTGTRTTLSVYDDNGNDVVSQKTFAAPLNYCVGAGDFRSHILADFDGSVDSGGTLNSYSILVPRGNGSDGSRKTPTIYHFNGSESNMTELRSCDGYERFIAFDYELDNDLDILCYGESTNIIISSLIINRMPVVGDYTFNTGGLPFCWGETITYSMESTDSDGDNMRLVADCFGNFSNLQNGSFALSNPTTNCVYDVEGEFTAALYVQDPSHPLNFSSNVSFSVSVTGQNDSVCFEAGSGNTTSEIDDPSLNTAGAIQDIGLSIDNLLQELGIISSMSKLLLALAIIIGIVWAAAARNFNWILVIILVLFALIIMAMDGVGLIPKWIVVLIFVIAAAFFGLLVKSMFSGKGGD